MKKLVFFMAVIGMILFSCTKDSTFKDDSTFEVSKIRSKDSSDPNVQFYDFDYVSQEIGIEPRDTNDIKYAKRILRQVKQMPTASLIQFEIMHQYGYPAWSLSKYDLRAGNEYFTILTPIYNFSEGANNGTIVTRLGFSGDVESVYFYNHKKMSSKKWMAFEPYYNELSTILAGSPPEPDDSVFRRDNPCKVSGCNAWCSELLGECIYLDGTGFKHCDIKCGKNSSGTSDDEEDGPNEIHFSSGGTSTSSGSTSWNNGNNDHVFPPMINPWGNVWWDMVNSFDPPIINDTNDDGIHGGWSFPPEEGGISSDVANDSTGTINIMDPAHLYPMQLEGFIEHYELDNTWDELDAELPQMCKALLAPDFYNCARFHLVNALVEDYDLNLTDLEKWYLFNNFEQYKEISNFLKSKGKTAYSSATASIYIGLADADLLNLTDSQVDGGYNDQSLENIITDKLADAGLSGQAGLDPATWYHMIKKEATRIGGDFVGAFLEATERSINQFWNEVIQPLYTSMEPVLSDIGDQFPSTSEEWRALMAVFGPMLIELGLDIGTDFIPVVGEVKAFTRCAIALSNGDYPTAIAEFLGGVAGIVPVGDLVVGAGKVVKAGAYIFTAFKVVKALAKVSKNIYQQLITYAQIGWKIAWDGGLKKLTFKTSSGTKIIEISDDVENLAPNVKILDDIAKDILDIGALKKLDAAVTIPNQSTSISLASKLKKEPANHLRYQPVTDDVIADVNKVIDEGDPTGIITEGVSRKYMTQDGFIHKDGMYNNRNNGYDNVFVNESTGEVIIDECKQWPPKLTGSNESSQWPTQMSDDWIVNVAERLENAGKIDLANAVRDAKASGKLTKTVTAIKKTNPDKGSIITIKVN